MCIYQQAYVHIHIYIHTFVCVNITYTTGIHITHACTDIHSDVFVCVHDAVCIHMYAYASHVCTHIYLLHLYILIQNVHTHKHKHENKFI